ncbi:MAG: ankyrin repeat domain-containing protein [Gammaproteobacteria bacterium]|nr:ankyrin repeat domain-containing protein [Gammaproteobacteria bacterium]
MHSQKESKGIVAQSKDDISSLVSTLKKPTTNNSHTILHKFYFVLHVGGLFYRSHEKWKPWKNFGMPLASALAHTGRVLIQMPKITPKNEKLLKRFRTWITHGAGDINEFSNQQFTDGFGTRISTHGVEVLNQNEAVEPGFFSSTKKYLKEIKVDGAISHALNGMFHKGINIAWNGSGNENPSNPYQRVSTDGEHGHLYVYCWVGDANSPGCFLIGIEPSAPGKKSAQLPDEAHHGIKATTSETGINGGDKFSDPRGTGLFQKIGPSTYYDGMCVLLDEKKIKEIMNEFLPSHTEYLSEHFHSLFSKASPTVEDVFNYMRSEPTEISALALNELLKANPVLCTQTHDFSYSKEWNLLHNAAYYGRSDLISVLVNNGVPINARDNYGCTPLLVCINSSKYDHENDKESADMIRKLLANGADLHKTANKWTCCFALYDYRKWSPLDHAESKKNKLVIAALKQNGAVSNKDTNNESSGQKLKK